MKKAILAALLLGAGLMPAPAGAQQATITQTIGGTRLDVNATGEVTRVPDVAIISAGVVSRSTTASAALQDTANRMDRVLAALKRAGVADRDIRSSGKILDALVGQGANQISGPNLVVDKPEAALDEARAKAIAIGRARADLYARSLGMRVARVVAVSESGGYAPPPPAPPMPMMARAYDSAESKIVPGEQKLQVNVAMTFELQ
jgi:uncharacterized protein YggE